MFRATQEDFKSDVRKSNRVLVLAKMDDKAPVSSTGTIDTRLFNGENKLHATYDGLWHMHYEMGAVPEPLKQQFTSFDRLYKCAEEYFKKRNVIIKEVID